MNNIRYITLCAAASSSDSMAIADGRRIRQTALSAVAKMRIAAHFVLIGALAACGAASGDNPVSTSTTPTTPTAPTVTTGTIVVRITDASGNLLPNSAFVLGVGGALSSYTSSSGQETFTNQAAGAVTLRGSKPGYNADSTSGFLSAGATVTLTVSLAPASSGGGLGSLTVRIQDPASKLLAGATYTLSGTVGGTFTASTGADVFTNNIPAGLVTVTASKSGYATNSASGTVAAGASATITVVLTPNGGTSTTGTVILNFKDPAGVALAGVSYVLSAGGGTFSHTAATASDTIGSVPSGQISVTATKSGYGSATGTGTLAAGATATLNVSLTPVAVAAVTVSPATVSLVQGASQALVVTTTDAAGNVLTGRAISFSSGNSSIATVDATGLVRGVGAGSTTVLVTSESKSSSVPVNVSAAAGSLTITPSSVSCNAGDVVNFQVAFNGTVQSTNNYTGQLYDAAGNKYGTGFATQAGIGPVIGCVSAGTWKFVVTGTSSPIVGLSATMVITVAGAPSGTGGSGSCDATVPNPSQPYSLPSWMNPVFQGGGAPYDKTRGASGGSWTTSGGNFTAFYTYAWTADAYLMDHTNAQTYLNGGNGTYQVGFHGTTFGITPFGVQAGTFYVVYQDTQTLPFAANNDLVFWVFPTPASIPSEQGHSFSYAAEDIGYVNQLAAQQRVTLPFTFSKGCRYFLRGVNSGVDSYVMDASQASNFLNGAQFTYYGSLSTILSDGTFEELLNLAPGNYVVGLRNRSAISSTGIAMSLTHWSIK